MAAKVLGPERAMAVQAAFKAWYQGLPTGARKSAMANLGEKLTNREASSFILGKRSPSPEVMKQLFIKTGNAVFRMTVEEKNHHRRLFPSHPFQDDPVNWPDLVEGEEDLVAKNPISTSPPSAKTEEKVSTELESVHKLAREFARLTKELRQYADLPEGDPQREEARKVLVSPAMKLFNATFKLHLKFPDAFKSILDQLQIAASIFSKD